MKAFRQRPDIPELPLGILHDAAGHAMPDADRRQALTLVRERLAFFDCDSRRQFYSGLIAELEAERRRLEEVPSNDRGAWTCGICGFRGYWHGLHC